MLIKILKIYGVLFDLEGLKDKYEKLKKKMIKPGFWDDNKKATKVSKKSKNIKRKIDKFNSIKESLDELYFYCEMAMDESNNEMYEEISNQYKSLKKEVENMKLEVLLDGEYDHLNAILDINSGSGGLDAQEWAEMLLKMYTKWAEKNGFDVEILDLIKDRQGGVKSVQIKIIGQNVTGFLKSEKGVHRLVRISPFDSSGKRHTSFASVDVMPEIDDTVDIEIDQSNLKIDTYRASGAGGQHVNTTDSAVRITHIPTGVVVQCQNQRSQLANKKLAMNMLKSKLISLKEQEQKEKIEDLMGDYSQITWGSQIRSYVFHPYQMVKDHRTNFEKGDVDKVMDGEIDEFINEYLKQS
ncbi:MAG: peptide chain release factor 2 [Bacillota bacterium]